ncbi:MAG: hypothetical protein ACKOJF_00360, partial [Planctomycetaceae bacterium]
MTRPYTLIDTWASVAHAPPDDLISVAELEDYLDRTWGSLLNITIRPPKVTATADLFALLDTNRDARLTETELTTAPARLSLLDLNDDESVTVDELVTPGLRVRDGTASRSPLVSLETSEQRSEALTRLLDEYGSTGGGGDRMVPVERVSLPPMEMDRIDLNGDKRLDRSELKDWLDNGTPHNVLGLELFRATRGKSQFF